MHATYDTPVAAQCTLLLLSLFCCFDHADHPSCPIGPRRCPSALLVLGRASAATGSQSWSNSETAGANAVDEHGYNDEVEHPEPKGGIEEDEEARCLYGVFVPAGVFVSLEVENYTPDGHRERDQIDCKGQDSEIDVVVSDVKPDVDGA
eukprot:CAMPEP_0170168048 /NCGR_PEP_ID=MMETSP0040_2-20121228/1242_1 /TAXON_ID=641309 /ORGANISM="Lotharella oceanica, Strain CCMP622" /LENGTH=148 /DNA_ID=CAMNT_0010406217 /DNA_START=118 /DNA_END=565 /DNA_ORIENTATION=-